MKKKKIPAIRPSAAGPTTSPPGTGVAGNPAPVLPPSEVLSTRTAWVLGLLLVGWGAFVHGVLPVGLPMVRSLWTALFTGLARALPVVLPGLAGRSLLVLLFWLAAAGLGSAVVRKLTLKGSRAELLLLSGGLGFGMMSLLLLGMGAVGLFRPAALKAVLAVLGGTSLVWWRPWTLGSREEGPPEAAVSPGRTGWRRVLSAGGASWAALVCLALAVALNAVSTMGPEIFYDSLTYHLALPNLYLLEGRIIATPHLLFSGLPLGAQLLYGLALSVLDEKLASLLHASLGLAAAGMVYLTGRRFLSGEQGVFAAMLFYAAPVTMFAGWHCGVDLFVSFYCAAALFAMLRGQEEGQGEGVRQGAVGVGGIWRSAPGPFPGDGWAWCCGLLLGFAGGTKYNALTVPVVMVLIQAWLDRRRGRSFRRSVIVAGAALAAFAPWMVKNLVFFKNPLYPFFTGVFPGGELIADFEGFFGEAGGRNPLSLLTSLPLLKAWILHQGTAFVGNWPTGDWAGVLLWVFAPWMLFVTWKRPAERAVLAFAVLGYLAWASTCLLVRYLLPVYPALCLAMAAAVGHARWPRVMRGLGWAVAVYVSLFQVQVVFRQGFNMDLWAYLTGRVTKERFLGIGHETYALPYYKAAQFINEKLPLDAKVLVLGESRTFYIEREAVAASVYDHNPFWTAAERARSAGELLADLRGQGLTHVLVSPFQFVYRRHSSAVFPSEVASRPMLREFWQRGLKLLFEDLGDQARPRWVLVYELLDEPSPTILKQRDPLVHALRMNASLDQQPPAKASGPASGPPAQP